MTISAAGWIDWTTQEPGPPAKVYAEPNLGAGIVWHSMEGWLAGSLRELMKPERKASWMFSLTLDGELIQHYPITASCWASGNFEANTSYWSVELEGTWSMPINEPQALTADALIAEWATWSGKAATRATEGKTLWEHREVATIATPNAGPTACPSERYAPLWASLEEDMTEDDVRRIIREEIAAARLVVLDAAGVPVHGDQDSVASLNEYVETLEVRLDDNLAAVQQQIDTLVALPGSPALANHHHEPGDIPHNHGGAQ